MTRQDAAFSTINITRRLGLGLLSLIIGGLGVISPASAQAQQQAPAPYRGYLEAHAPTQNPPQLLGGGVEMTVVQQGGGVQVALPSQRELDEDVFGTPDAPRAFGGTPGINGVPLKLRGQENGEFIVFQKNSPFGNKAQVLPGAHLQLKARDLTAVDGAKTEDEVTFLARWNDREGNEYTVRCCQKLATHGVEFPTFGGVVTHHILHGSSRLGTALMPTEFAYLAFWGMGSVHKNGEVLDKPRLVHGMLTEYVRTEGYQLAQDHEVTPTRKHFHLMVPPMEPLAQEGRFHHKAVQTGFELPNGKELPFWHVMFGNLQVQTQRGRR